MGFSSSCFSEESSPLGTVLEDKPAKRWIFKTNQNTKAMEKIKKIIVLKERDQRSNPRIEGFWQKARTIRLEWISKGLTEGKCPTRGKNKCEYLD